MAVAARRMVGGMGVNGIFGDVQNYTPKWANSIGGKPATKRHWRRRKNVSNLILDKGGDGVMAAFKTNGTNAYGVAGEILAWKQVGGW